MGIIHYNVDKTLEHDRLVVINNDEPLSLYSQSANTDFYLSDTHPEFLARFRRSNHDGSLISKSVLETIVIPAGCRVIIKLDGGVGILFIDGSYAEFNGNAHETLIKKEFPGHQFGKFHSYIGMTMFNFNHYLDSFRKNHIFNISDFESPFSIEDLYFEDKECM